MTEFKTGAITGSIVLDLSGWTTSVNRIARESQAVDAKINGIGKAAAAAFKNPVVLRVAGIAGVTGGIAGIALAMKRLTQESVRAAMQFESAFAGVRKTVEATEYEFQKFSDQILELAREIPISANALADLASVGGQLGIQNENLMKFTETMANLGVATNMTAEQAATSIARWANITQMPQANIQNLASVIVDLGNNFATTEGEITAMGLRLAGIGKQAGISDAKIAGIAATLSSLGLEAEAAGTAFSRFMADLTSSAQMGGEKLDLFAQLAKQSSDEFRRAYSQDAMGQIIKVLQGIGDYAAKNGNVFKLLEVMGMDDVRLRDAILRTVNAQGLLKEATDRATNAWSENTALVEEAQKRFGTSESKMQILKNTSDQLARNIGEILRPAWGGLIETMSGAIGKMEEITRQSTAVNKAFADAYALQKQISMGLALRGGSMGAAGGASLAPTFQPGDFDRLQKAEQLLESITDLASFSTEDTFQILSGMTAIEAVAAKLREHGVLFDQSELERQLKTLDQTADSTKKVGKETEEVNKRIAALAESSKKASSNLEDAGKRLYAVMRHSVSLRGIVEPDNLMQAGQAVQRVEESIQALQAAGRLSPSTESLLGVELYQDIQSMGTTAIDALIAKVREISTAAADAAEKMRMLAAERMFTEDFALTDFTRDPEGWNEGLPQFDPAEYVKYIAGESFDISRIEAIGQAVNNLIAEGRIDPGAVNALAPDLYYRLGAAGTKGLREIADALKRQGGAAEDLGNKLEKQSKLWAKTSSDKMGWGGTADNIGRVGAALSQLGPKFQKVAQGAQLAQDAIRLAMSPDPVSMLINAIMLAADALGLFGKEEQQTFSSAERWMQRLESEMESWADRMSDALIEVAETGKFEWQEMVTSMLEDLARIAMSELVFKPLLGVGSAKGNIFSDGAVVPFAKGGVIYGPALAPMALMGERGPEAVVPLARDRYGDLGIKIADMERQGVNLVINDMRSAGAPDIEIEERDAPNGQRVLLLTIRDGVERLAAQGGLTRALKLAGVRI